MSESLRSFLAFDIESDIILSKLATVQNMLFQTGADLKLVDPQNIHVTLRFLGNITLSSAEKIFEEMKKVQFSPFTLEIKGLGVFPDLRYPRVVWAGITDGVDQLKSIFSQIEPRLRGLDFTSDSRGFSPHLTIARVRSGRNKQQLSEFLTQNANYEFGKFTANCLRLKKSTLTPKGPVYSTLKEFCPPK
jgi:RNA 2',3'-cyclic 3'-phosphodiesterase